MSQKLHIGFKYDCFNAELRHIIGKIKLFAEKPLGNVFSSGVGAFDFQKEEIDEVRFFTPEELKDPEWRKVFTPCLIGELERLYGE